MGNTQTPTPGEDVHNAEEDLDQIQNHPNESEVISQSFFEEMERKNGFLKSKISELLDFFNKFIHDTYQNPLSHLRETYKIKKNYAVRYDLIYKIYVVENIHSKVLHNLKIFKIPLTKLTNNEFDLIDQDSESYMLINDIEAMQKFRSTNVDILYDFYVDVKKDSIILMFISTYTTPYTLLDAMNEKIAENKKFSEMEFEQILKFLLELLNKMKNNNIIHRGICPSSIFFQKKNDYSSLIMKNFFFSSNSEMGTARGLTGTLWYSAPEILMDSDQDFKVDIYSVGVILYQVLTLKNPFQNLTKKEDVLKKIADNSIQKSLDHCLKLGYNRIYIEKIKTMVKENQNSRCSIDDIISKVEIKKIRLKQVKYFLKDYSNSIFNLKLNRNILDKFKEVLDKTHKGLCGLIFHIFNSGKEYIMDHPMVIKANILFDFLDINNNNFVTTDEFRDKLIELLIDTEDEINIKENREIVKDYADSFKEIFESLFDNEYFKMNNIDSKQFDFNSFLVASLIIWFFDERERSYIRKTNKDNGLNKNEAERATFKKSYNNDYKENTKKPNEYISILDYSNVDDCNNGSKHLNNTNNINNNSITNNNQINRKFNFNASNNLRNKNSNITNSKEKSAEIIKSLEDKRNNYGKDFDINNPECISMPNEKKLNSFINAFFDTKNYIAFDTLIFDKRKFDTKIFSQVEKYLIENFMDKANSIFEINHEENKNYLSKEKFVKLLEFEFIK